MTHECLTSVGSFHLLARGWPPPTIGYRFVHDGTIRRLRGGSEDRSVQLVVPDRLTSFADLQTVFEAS